MKGTFHKSIVDKTMLYIILAFYLLSICLLNFSAVPSFYDADMYCDYRYAMEAWNHKSLFPDGWVFGNQLNAVSTPVLAAILYGVTNSMNFSMALACVMMSVLLVLSFDWMIKAVIRSPESRLMAIVLLITISLYCGRAVHGNQGWTLLFTMCSYYAGYGITAFLAFGCYIRGLLGTVNKQTALMVAVTCILCFGTGIQSIRQTAIMVVPILAVEFLRFITMFRVWKTDRTPFWLAAGITVSNIMGLCYVRMREINQNQIFGPIELTSLRDVKQAITSCFAMIKDLLGADHPEAFFLLACFGILCLVALIFIFRNAITERKYGIAWLTLLIGFSVLVIIAIDVLTTMYIRPRYYFMLYPLISFLVAYLHDSRNIRMKKSLLAFVTVFFCLACVRNLPEVCVSAIRHNEEDSFAISDYLLKKGYTTVYAEWNRGHDVSIASDGRIDAGYWYVEERPFEKVTHLCSLDIYERDGSECVYLFVGEDDAQTGISTAESVGVPLEFVEHFPESDTYLYTAPVNLMQIFDGKYL